MVTCEGCNLSSEEMVTNELCEECSDKAGRFDLMLLERDQLLTTVKDTLAELAHASEVKNEYLRVTFIHRAIGRLKVAKHCCESR